MAALHCNQRGCPVRQDALHPRGLINLEGSCPWLDPWVLSNGAHLLWQVPGIKYSTGRCGFALFFAMIDQDRQSVPSKASLRRAALARRDSVDGAGRKAATRAIMALKPMIDARWPRAAIAGFMPFGSEIDPRPLMVELATAGRNVGIPKVVGKAMPLVFRQWALDDDLAKGPYGIREPLDSQPVIAPDIFLVPLAAFDDRLYRIGYGGGFYDRSLAEAAAARPIITIGLAFAVQVIDRVPNEAHDVALDAILTENGLYGEL